MIKVTPPKAAIFDMDGTLVDNMHIHHQAWMEFIKEKELNIDATTFERDYHKGTLIEVMQRFFPDLTTEEELRAVGNEKEALYRQIFTPHIQPLAGLIDFLITLAQQGIPMGLATMGDQNNINLTLDGLGIRNYFNSTTGGHQVKKGKPDPEIFLLAAKKIGVSPSECLAFEDTQSGITSALAAGMQVVGIATQFSTKELKALGCVAAIDDYTSIRLI